MSDTNIVDKIAICLPSNKPLSHSVKRYLYNKMFENFKISNRKKWKKKNRKIEIVTLKRLGVNLTPPLSIFQKCIFQGESQGETLFFSWLLILSCKSNLSWKFHWNSWSRPEDIKTFSVNISYFCRFLSIFWIFWYFLVTKKLMTSVYNT